MDVDRDSPLTLPKGPFLSFPHRQTATCNVACATSLAPTWRLECRGQSAKASLTPDSFPPPPPSPSSSSSSSSRGPSWAPPRGGSSDVGAGFSWADYRDHRCDTLSPPSPDLNVTSVALDEFVAWGHKDSNASIVREDGRPRPRPQMARLNSHFTNILVTLEIAVV